MKITENLTDDMVMLELGQRIARLRIDRNLSQSGLAQMSGVGKRTLERLENGTQVQTRSLIRVLRSLEQLDALNILLPEADLRPMEALSFKGKSRKRVSRSRKKSDASKTWTWGSET